MGAGLAAADRVLVDVVLLLALRGHHRDSMPTLEKCAQVGILTYFVRKKSSEFRSYFGQIPLVRISRFWLGQFLFGMLRLADGI